MVINLAFRYVQSVEDAEEITQEVFVSIHQSLSTFDHRADIKTWIYRITVNKSLDHIKAKKRQKRFGYIVSLFSLVDTASYINVQGHEDPSYLYEQNEAVKNIYQKINQLPVNQKSAIILCRLEQKSQQEAAEIMNTSVKAIESLLQRAKANLMTSMKSGI